MKNSNSSDRIYNVENLLSTMKYLKCVTLSQLVFGATIDKEGLVIRLENRLVPPKHYKVILKCISMTDIIYGAPLKKDIIDRSLFRLWLF